MYCPHRTVDVNVERERTDRDPLSLQSARSVDIKTAPWPRCALLLLFLIFFFFLLSACVVFYVFVLAVHILYVCVCTHTHQTCGRERELWAGAMKPDANLH